MERARVARKMPSEVVANRWSTVPTRNSSTDPSMGTRSAPWSTKKSEKAVAVSTTSPMDQTFASMISAGVTGMTSRCSMVPCSRSRMSAAPVRTMASMVTMLISSISEPNQAWVRLGLNRARSTRSTGGASLPRTPRTNSSTSASAICWMEPLPLKAWLMRVASTLSCRAGARPASTSRWNPGGMSSTKVWRPLSMPGSTSSRPIITGRRKWGG